MALLSKQNTEKKDIKYSQIEIDFEKKISKVCKIAK